MRSCNNSSSYDVDIIVFILWKVGKMPIKIWKTWFCCWKDLTCPFLMMYSQLEDIPGTFGWCFYLFKWVEEKWQLKSSSASYNLRWFEMLCTSKYKLETALVENYDNLSTGLQTHTYVVNMFEMVGRYLKYT